jgi:hypothetical protein
LLARRNGGTESLFLGSIPSPQGLLAKIPTSLLLYHLSFSVSEIHFVLFLIIPKKEET